MIVAVTWFDAVYFMCINLFIDDYIQYIHMTYKILSSDLFFFLHIFFVYTSCHVHAHVHAWYSTVLFKDMHGVLLYASNLYFAYCCNTFDHLRSLCYIIFIVFCK